MSVLNRPEAGNHVEERLAVRIPEAIRITGMGKTTIYSLIASGEIAVVKVGRMTLIPIASLKELLERHRHRHSHKLR